MTTKLEPGTDAWRRIVTASKAAAILGVSPYDSPRSMWHLMRGDLPPAEVKPQHTRGHFLEAPILAWWESTTPGVRRIRRQVQRTLARYPWAAATLDALAHTEDGPVIVEAKSSARAEQWGEPGTDDIPLHYLTQCHFQLALTPRAVRVDVPVLLGPGLEFRTYRVERDQDIENAILTTCREFYDSLTSETAPALDGHVATLDAVRSMHPDINREAEVEIPAHIAEESRAAAAAKKDAEARERAARAQLLNLMGDARLATVHGQAVARRQGGTGGSIALRILTPSKEAAA